MRVNLPTQESCPQKKNQTGMGVVVVVFSLFIVVCVCALGCQKRVLDTLKLRLQAVGELPTPGYSSGRTVCTLNQ